jgi:hypothetical protein
LLVDGGGNDAADLTAASGCSRDGAAYRALLTTLVPAATVDAFATVPLALQMRAACT